MRTKLNCKLIFLFWHLLCLACIAAVSGYSMAKASDVNLDIATMLTPFGLIKNLWVQKEASPLYPFYFRPTHRGGAFEHPLIFALIALIWIQAIIVLKKIKVKIS